MEAPQVEQGKPKKSWRLYLGSGIGILLTVLLIAVTVIFHKEIRNLQAYGYLGVFVVGILCGITIIPTPVLLLVLTFGAILNPLYVGLIAGLGSAIGGITVYLTGAGMETIWSKFRVRILVLGRRLGMGNDSTKLARSKLWSRWEAFYNRLASWVGGKGGYWVLFISSAMIISPFYFTGMAAGSLRLGLLRFLLISWAGKSVRYLIVAFAGYYGLSPLLKLIGG
ncbi:hypothetical protein ACFLVH_01555 [Chloroflexota bacterium]